MQRSRFAKTVALPAWTVAMCILSQIPYQMVWRGLSTFPYDAFTTFDPWFVGQLAKLRAGEGLLNLYQDEVPFDIWPSYFFSGLVRQIFFFLQANSAVGHALVQAVHSVLLVPAVALLLRSVRVPWQYGVVGGLVFTLSGIHLSLSQHVLAHEALLYLVLSLWALRELVTGWPCHDLVQRIAWFGFSGVVLVSLVRVHHEAILYVLPLAGWTLGHLIVLYRGSGWQAAWRVGSQLAVLAALVAVASVPMLVSAYELSLVNKTQIASYGDLGHYFSDTRAFFMSLVLPGFAGGNAPTMPLPFGFHQEATLSYVFFGTLTLPLLVVVLVSWWRSGQRAAAVVLASMFVIVLGYTVGAGSPVHLALCALFPFLIKIGHNYYGFHLVYLLGAFAVAEGLRIVVERRGLALLAGTLTLQASVLLYFSAQAIAAGGWGLDGSFEAFHAMLSRDLRWHAAVVVAVVGGWGFARLFWQSRQTGDSLVHPLGWVWPHAIALMAMTTLIAADLQRPAIGAHFLPGSAWVSWATSPLGGFNPSREVRRFLNEQQAHTSRPLRVLPIFPRGGGWQGNALMATDMHLVGTPGDSGGNRYVEAWLSLAPDPSRVLALVDRFGVDAVWVARWGVDDWRAAVVASGLARVFSSPYGGDVYMRRPSASGAVFAPGPNEVPWGVTVSKLGMDEGLITRSWRFRTTPRLIPQQGWISLPLMWHAGYAIDLPDGQPAQYGHDRDGRLMVRAGGQRGEFVVRYPSAPLAWLVAAAASVYLGLLAMMLGAGATMIRRRWGTQQPASAP
jgi:hypothetical protein